MDMPPKPMKIEMGISASRATRLGDSILVLDDEHLVRQARQLDGTDPIKAYLGYYVRLDGWPYFYCPELGGYIKLDHDFPVSRSDWSAYRKAEKQKAQRQGKTLDGLTPIEKEEIEYRQTMNARSRDRISDSSGAEEAGALSPDPTSVEHKPPHHDIEWAEGRDWWNN